MRGAASAARLAGRRFRCATDRRCPLASRPPSAVVLVLLVAFPLPSRAGVVLGGGKDASDCYGAFDVAGADGGRRLVCVDGDPACDVDGACQGSCTFRVAVCLNVPDVEGCTPKPLRKATASDPLVVPTLQDAEAVCGAPVAMEVPLRGGRETGRVRRSSG